MTHEIEVKRVASNSAEERGFIDLPDRIYAGNPNYVPWFRRGLRRMIARRHPFFAHSDGEFFVATRGGRTVGRLTALEPKRFNEYQGKQDARFYFFESEDDEAIARALFERAGEWAVERGLNTLVGPKGFSAFTGNGILIDGFNYCASMTMMPYHLPYYGPLMEACGFEKSQDFYSALLREGVQDLSARYRRAAEIARKRSRLEVPRLRSKRELKRVAAEVGRVYNESWDDHADFTPVTEAELQEMVDDLMVVTTPSLIRVFRSKDEVAGFVLAFPDISRAMQRAKGRLNPLSMLLLLWEKRKTSHYLVNGLGILPKYRKSGGLPLLFTEITDALREHGASTAEMTQIADTTDLMLSNIEKLGGEVYKTHRVYQKSLP